MGIYVYLFISLGYLVHQVNLFNSHKLLLLLVYELLQLLFTNIDTSNIEHRHVETIEKFLAPNVANIKFSNKLPSNALNFKKYINLFVVYLLK